MAFRADRRHSPQTVDALRFTGFHVRLARSKTKRNKRGGYLLISAGSST